MNLLKRIISVGLSASVLAGVFVPAAVSASAKDTSSVIYDFNGDKVSDEKDVEDIISFNKKTYAPILQEMLYGGLKSTDFDTSKADGIPRYFLTNIDECTTPRLQKPIGDCWAQASIGMLESSALKAKHRLKNPSGEIDSRAFSEPVLSGLSNEVLYSPRATAWFLGEPLSQKETSTQVGEGTDYPDNGIDRFVDGGMNALCETLFTAWRSVFDESQFPHFPNGWDATLKNLNSNKDWFLPDNLSGKSFSKAPRVTDCLYLPSASEFTFTENKERVWKKCDTKARSIIKQALIDYGAVQMSSDSADEKFSAMYSDKEKSLAGHTLLIVGWDDNYPKDNYKGKSKTPPTEDGAWLVKNTFGSYDYMKSAFRNWDIDREGIYGMTYEETQAFLKEKNTTLEEQLKSNPLAQNKYAYETGIRDENDRGTGFYWVYYCDKTVCAHAVYNVDIPDDGYDYDNNYQYDYSVSYDDIRLSLRTADKDTLVSNVFTSKGDEKLKAFSAYTNATDSVVKTWIYLLDGSESNPTEGELVYSTEDKVKFAGFHTIRLNKEIDLAKGQKFAVVQNIRSYDKSTDAEVSFLNLETIIDNSKVFVSPVKNTVICNDGETFVRLDGSWTTPKELDKNLEIASIVNFGNAKIKAFTVNSSEQPTEEATDYPTTPLPTQAEYVPPTETTEPAETAPSTAVEPSTTVTEPSTAATEPIATESQPTTSATEPSEKKANPVSVTVKSKTVKAKALRKKAQKVNAVTVKNAQGKVAFKLSSVPKKLKKLVKISSKGVITINKWKKAKKGSFNIKIKITAKGNSEYKSRTVTKTVKIKIK